MVWVKKPIRSIYIRSVDQGTIEGGIPIRHFSSKRIGATVRLTPRILAGKNTPEIKTIKLHLKLQNFLEKEIHAVTTYMPNFRSVGYFLIFLQFFKVPFDCSFNFFAAKMAYQDTQNPKNKRRTENERTKCGVPCAVL